MKEYNKEDCIKETKEHISQVRFFLIQFAIKILTRAMVHDNSKLESPELDIFTVFTPQLRTLTYGSEDYQSTLKKMEKALDHHYSKNSHHPEHYSDGINGMNLVDIVEMICDWKASSMRHDDGNIRNSIDFNQKRFKIDQNLINIINNTLNEMNW